jgi:hypothetical protein
MPETKSRRTSWWLVIAIACAITLATQLVVVVMSPPMFACNADVITPGAPVHQYGWFEKHGCDGNTLFPGRGGTVIEVAVWALFGVSIVQILRHKKRKHA